MMTAKKVILNTVFYVLFIPVTLATVTILSSWVYWGRLRSYREAMRRLRIAIRWYGRIIIWGLPQPFLKVRYRDKSGEAMIPTPCIVICNHRSSSDPFLMACFSFEAVQIVNIWPFKIPLLGFFARLAGYLSVNEMSFEEFSQRCGELLDEGVSIIAFPEGTRSGAHAMGQFRGAMFRIALEKKIPIVPLCISGNEDKPVRGSFWMNPGTVLLHRLPTLTYEQIKEMNPFKLKNHVRDIIETETKIMDARS
ncbi:MAG: 1-acyl-sn-glycerol-3-phosphate acyltransferase [Candidatus Omnitrophica bacterium]|nr:1-acyl-sn-glycerol-3-phosphate acyltransferase [Candidatus Omnitrophota bacterium]